MIYYYFFLKYKSQINKVRPEIIKKIEDFQINSIKEMGGKMISDRQVVSSVFNEKVIGFWLDLYIFLETTKNNLEGNPEIYGYSLLISSNEPEDPDLLCRFLANSSGIYADVNLAKKLSSYAAFDKPSQWLNDKGETLGIHKYNSNAYYKIRSFKTFSGTLPNFFNMQKEVLSILEQNDKNILIIGSPYSQMESGLAEYCGKINEEFPPVKINFEKIGIGPVADIWSPQLRSLYNAEKAEYLLLTGRSADEIDNMHELLFRERFRDEVSRYMIRCAAAFILKIFEFYFFAAKKRNKKALLLIENIHLAQEKTAGILTEFIKACNERNEDLTVIAAGEANVKSSKALFRNQDKWEGVFSRYFKIEKQDKQKFLLPKLPSELLEIIYAISQLNRFFPSYMIIDLLTENFFSRTAIERALQILNNLGIIEDKNEPKPANRYYGEYAGKKLELQPGRITGEPPGEKSIKVKKLIAAKLLNLAQKRRINPCFNLLAILAYYDYHSCSQPDGVSDIMLLKLLCSDIINGTASSLLTVIREKRLKKILGTRGRAARRLLKTFIALYGADIKRMDGIFSYVIKKDMESEYEQFPQLKTQLLANLGLYHLIKHDANEAAKKAKEAILLGTAKNPYCLPQSYRIYALVCLSRQQAGEANEYFAFALDNAQRHDNYHEAAVCSYYAAVSQFLYGDIFTSLKYAKQSVEKSTASCLPEWADKSLFLEGRICFELGQYAQAMEIFSKILLSPFGEKTYEKESLLAAWIYRCKIYGKESCAAGTGSHEPQSNLQDGASPIRGLPLDAQIFEMEAAFIKGEYKSVIEKKGSFENFALNENFYFTETPDWSSGFAQIEQLYFINSEIQNRLVSMYYSMALVSLDQGNAQEALKIMDSILRDEKLCEMDPCEALYFFAKYLILEKADTGLDDSGTAVSIAFKRLQKRAGRIEDSETRRQYMNAPLWNNELCSAARENKLI